MPTYQYACTECGERIEVVQRFTDGPLTECPSCGGPLRKVFSPVGVVFKGSGFYRTDSRNAASGSAKPKTTDGAEVKSSGSSDSSSSGSGDKGGAASKSSDTAGKNKPTGSSSKTSAA